MKEFILLNNWKLVFAFKCTSAIFTLFALILFLIANNEIQELTVYIVTILGASIGIPIFIIIITVLRGTWDFKKRKKAFATKPFSDLTQYGFIERLEKEKSKWSFSEPVLEGEISGFLIIAEVNTQYESDVIRFQALTNYNPIEKEEFQRLKRIFKSEDIEFDWNGITKKISIKNMRFASVKELRNELIRFIKIIEHENFKPRIKAEQNNEL